MVSRIGYVQKRRDVVVLLLVIVGGLIMQSSADDAKTHDKRQLENDWASTSKKDHKGPNTYQFSYDVENSPTSNVQYRMEERHPNGSVVGSYGQVQPDGKIRVVSYVADKDGIKTYVKDNGAKPAITGSGEQYEAAGSSLDPVQRVTSQIIQTAVKSQQHKSPLHDKYHRPTPASGQNRVDNAHAYHQQRTNVDPAAFRPEDSPGYQDSNQPFIGDHLKDKLQSTYGEYQSASPQQVVQQNSPLQLAAPVAAVPYNVPGVGAVAVTGARPSPQPSHYVLNVPPLPALADNSPLPLLPGQQPLPITPDRGPILIQLQQPQPAAAPPNQPTNYQYQPTQVYQQQLRLPPAQHQQQQQQQQQFLHPSQAQQYQQQPVRVQPPAHLQQQARLAAPSQQVVQQYHPQQAKSNHQTPPPAAVQYQYQQQQQQQQQQKPAYQFPQQVNIPAQPSQLQQLRGNVQQQQTVVPIQYFHQPNPATTVEQYRQQLQLQAAESQIIPVFVLPPSNSVFNFKRKPILL